ncbi:MAG TPA: His/Gly/Thr/Pro-type tRNA ligase C-terminal domain-containing protein, partial [Candidatus Obscuribacter sp.]|nr:His/Gly/Thr/Pro-type tRNA ligase C-terminal domain-containing protein [Candidatus Obscuribacter sp.]
LSCGQSLALSKGLEIGHIFKLGVRYSESLGASVLDSEGQKRAIFMGSYGIGVERLMAACVEAFSDEKGIVWPVPIAPYTVVITVIGDDTEIVEKAESLYYQLQEHGVDVLLDDREGSPGVKFAESELLGIPYRVTVGKKLKAGLLELTTRAGRKQEEIPAEDAHLVLLKRLGH